MTGADPNDGNRLIFKPSPLKGLAKATGSEMAVAPDRPLEVTAVPHSAGAPLGAAPASAQTAEHRDDVTTFSFEPLPAMAPAPEKPEPAAAEAARPSSAPREEDGRAWAYLLLLAAAAAILVALNWLGLI